MSLFLQRNGKRIIFSELLKEQDIFIPKEIEFGSNGLRNNSQFNIINNAEYTFFNHDGINFIFCIKANSELIVSGSFDDTIDLFDYIFKPLITPVHLLYSIKHILFLLDYYLKYSFIQHKEISFGIFTESFNLLEKLFTNQNFIDIIKNNNWEVYPENYTIRKL